MEDDIISMKDYETIFAYAIEEMMYCPQIFFVYEKDHLSLYIGTYLATFLGCDNTFKNNEYVERKIRIGFSYGLAKYLKGFL